MPKTDEQVFVSVNGLPVEIAAAKLIGITVDQSLVLPDAFDIILTGGLEWLKDDTFGFGKEVKIDMASGLVPKTLISGEVTALDTTLSFDNEVQLAVRGYDRSHRLLRGRQTRSFIQVTDSDLASRVAMEAGLAPDVSATFTIYDHVLQHNETNMEFLRRRASRIGYEVGVSDRSLYFKPIGEPGAMQLPLPVTLRWGENLDSISFSHASSAQATKVVVRGWDHAKKQEVIGEARSSSAGPQIDRDQVGSDVVQSAYGVDSPMVILDASVGSQTEAEALAQAAMDELQGSFITAIGLAAGDPAITPGAEVTIEGAGIYDGTYVVSEATHSFDRGGYRTSFKVGGSRMLARVPGGPNGHQKASAGQDAGLAIAIVTNNTDPENLGRVKVKFPWLADDLESDWCRIASPMAGADRGFFALPEVNDEVLVAGVNWSRPIVLGSLWNSSDKPPLTTLDAVVAGKVVQRVFKTRTGHTLLFDDTDGAEGILIQDSKGNQIVIDSVTGNIEINGPGNLEITASRNLTLQAGGNIDIKGTRINLN